MNGSEFYYGVHSDRWDKMYYFDAIEDRRNLARDLYFKLYKEQESSNKLLNFKHRYRTWKVEKAWKLNQKLLDERNLIV